MATRRGTIILIIINIADWSCSLTVRVTMRLLSTTLTIDFITNRTSYNWRKNNSWDSDYDFGSDWRNLSPWCSRWGIVKKEQRAKSTKSTRSSLHVHCRLRWYSGGKKKKKGGICNFHYNWKFREHIFFDADTRKFLLHVHAVCLLFRHTAMSYLRSLSSKSIASGLTRSSFSECVNLSHLFLECLRQNNKKIEYADVKQKRTRKLCLHMDLTHIVAPFLCIEATSSVTNTPGGDIDPWHNIRLNSQFGGWVPYHDRNSSDQMVWRSNPTRSVGHLVCSLSKARDEWLRVWFDLILFTQK